jgi:hypothetical protein
MFFDKPCKACWWLLSVGILTTLGLGSFIIRAWDKVASGKGLDVYFTGWGVQFNYVGFLVLVAIIPLVLLIGYGVRYWELRHERDFKRKYGNDI